MTSTLAVSVRATDDADARIKAEDVLMNLKARWNNLVYVDAMPLGDPDRAGRGGCKWSVKFEGHPVDKPGRIVAVYR